MVFHKHLNPRELPWANKLYSLPTYLPTASPFSNIDKHSAISSSLFSIVIGLTCPVLTYSSASLVSSIVPVLVPVKRTPRATKYSGPIGNDIFCGAILICQRIVTISYGAPEGRTNADANDDPPFAHICNGLFICSHTRTRHKYCVCSTISDLNHVRCDILGGY